MLRIADPKDVPVNAIIFCASCKKAVYVVTGNDSRTLAIKSLKLGRITNSLYNIIWCTLCHCEVQLNLKALYIPPIDAEDLLNDRISLGRRIMAFEYLPL